MKDAFNIANPRWRVALSYRRKHGVETAYHYIEEISDLENIIEHGPDWNTLVKAEITLNPARVTHPNDTIEAAEAR